MPFQYQDMIPEQFEQFMAVLREIRDKLPSASVHFPAPAIGRIGPNTSAGTPMSQPVQIVPEPTTTYPVRDR